MKKLIVVLAILFVISPIKAEQKKLTEREVLEIEQCRKEIAIRETQITSLQNEIGHINTIINYINGDIEIKVEMPKKKKSKKAKKAAKKK